MYEKNIIYIQWLVIAILGVLLFTGRRKPEPPKVHHYTIHEGAGIWFEYNAPKDEIEIGLKEWMKQRRHNENTTQESIRPGLG